mgnify:FL=1
MQRHRDIEEVQDMYMICTYVQSCRHPLRIPPSTYLLRRYFRGFASHAHWGDCDLSAVSVEPARGPGSGNRRDRVPHTRGDGCRAGGDSERGHPGRQEMPAPNEHEGVNREDVVDREKPMPYP